MDWLKIKTEYITTDTSYRKLCEKYDVPYSTLSRRAKAEDWPSLRTQSEVKTTSEVVNAFADKQADRIKKMQGIADKLLEKIAEGLEEYDATRLVFQSQTLRHITGALRDLKEVLSIKSELDKLEQEARIAKLRKEAAEETEEDNNTEVTFTDGDVKEWSE